MGRVIADICGKDAELHVVAGFDIVLPQTITFPVYSKFEDFTGTADALIDFSSPGSIDDGLLAFCVKRKIPAVLCTTGYSEAQTALIGEAAKLIPIFKSANMSIGINLLADIVREAAGKLGIDFDAEIVESHHRQKVDAPSGTALLLADAVKSGRSDKLENVYERQSRREPRGSGEIGISAVRGGTIPGEHTVIFAGRDEVIEFKHTVYSREVFAAGAVRAAKFIADIKEPGFYSKF
jgi:4-hydroxy-tetrahydrodipicolinate reductase